MKKRQRLESAVKQNIKRANAEGTQVNHQSQHKKYLEFCSDYQFKPFPASEWQICLYSQYLSDQDKKPRTIENYVSFVRVFHKLVGLSPPDLKNIHYQWLCADLKRNGMEPVKQAHPIDHDKLTQIFLFVNLADELHAVAWTAILVSCNLVMNLMKNSILFTVIYKCRRVT